MALSLQECIDKIKKEYPNHYPYTYVETNGKYIFNIVQKGHDPQEAISDMHIVDPDSGYVSGGISIMEFLKDPKFREKWKKPNLVANHDDSLGHSSIHRNEFEKGWRVRRNTNFSYGGSLSHYGIKGQHWGERNGPPYPLDQKTHNSVVKKAEIAAANDGKAGLIPELVTLAALIGIDLYLNSPRVIDKRKQKRQKKYNEKNKAISEDLLGDIANVDKTYSEDSMPRMIEGEHSSEDDLLACNPRFKNGVVPGTTNNCTLCAFTYDMRRRGYDVMALASEVGSYPEQVVKDLYKNAKVDNIKARNFTDMFKKAAEKYPEGARGELHLMGPFMGHSMAWEIRNHELVVLDPQRNETHTAQKLKEYGFYSNHNLNGFIRTDNLEVNPSGINVVCAEYKKNWKQTIADEQKASSNNQSRNKTAGLPKLSDAQRRKNYEEAYLKEHPNADKNSEGLKNWVNAQMNS